MSVTETTTETATVVANATSQINVIDIPDELVSQCGNWIRFEYMDKFYNVGDRHVVEILTARHGHGTGTSLPEKYVLMELTVPTKQDAIRIGQTLHHIAKSVHTFEDGCWGKYEIELQPWSFTEHLVRHCK